MMDLLELLKPQLWVFEKSYHGCDLYRRDDNKNQVAFRVETRFPYPPSVLFEYFRNLEKRMIWDGHNYESLNQVKTFEMNTFIYLVNLKKQWPLGNRDLLLLFQGLQTPDGSIYLASKSTEHQEFPELPKNLRVATKSGSYLFQAEKEGRVTKFIYVTEFDFKGSLPKYVVQKAAQASFIDNIQRLRKLLEKLESQHKYQGQI